MKTVYLNKDGIKPELRIWLPETRLLEKKDRDLAIKEYKKMASAYPLNEEIYDRLMILYRQSKDPVEELRWIDKAIQVFEKSFAKPRAEKNSKIISLSKSILKSTGLVDRKGKSVFQRQPIGRWQKRKDLVKARIEAFR